MFRHGESSCDGGVHEWQGLRFGSDTGDDPEKVEGRIEGLGSVGWMLKYVPGLVSFHPDGRPTLRGRNGPRVVGPSGGRSGTGGRVWSPFFASLLAQIFDES